MRSAERFQLVTFPSRSLPMIASSEDFHDRRQRPRAMLALAQRAFVGLAAADVDDG